MAMDPQKKTEWVAALRSGKYEQCTSHLHTKNGGGYCCLGVLADIQPGVHWAGGNGYDGRMVPMIGDIHLSYGGLDESTLSGRLSATFSIEMGILRESAELMAMNDKGKSFAEIAT